jgi:hypothetical protein
MIIDYEPVATRILERAQKAIANHEGAGPALDETWEELDKFAAVFIENHHARPLVEHFRPTGPRCWETIRDKAELILTNGVIE